MLPRPPRLLHHDISADEASRIHAAAPETRRYLLAGHPALAPVPALLVSPLLLVIPVLLRPTCSSSELLRVRASDRGLVCSRSPRRKKKEKISPCAIRDRAQWGSHAQSADADLVLPGSAGRERAGCQSHARQPSWWDIVAVNKAFEDIAVALLSDSWCSVVWHAPALERRRAVVKRGSMPPRLAVAVNRSVILLAAGSARFRCDGRLCNPRAATSLSFLAGVENQHVCMYKSLGDAWDGVNGCPMPAATACGRGRSHPVAAR